MKFIKKKSFLSKSLCKDIIQYFETNQDPNIRNINPDYNGRIVFCQTMKDDILKHKIYEKVLDIIKIIRKFYNIHYNLYADSTHIVKWNEGSSLGEHADAYYADGTPNYTPWRKFSSVCYLNDNYCGGIFRFTKKNIDIVPSRGTMIGFTSGVDDMHEVTKILKNKRYTISLWFTDDPAKDIWSDYKIYLKQKGLIDYHKKKNRLEKIFLVIFVLVFLFFSVYKYYSKL